MSRISALLLFAFVATACSFSAAQKLEPLPPVPAPAPGNDLSDQTAPPGGSLSYANFNYSSNTADLPGPDQYPSGLDKGQVAGIVVGCVLGGLVLGAALTLCWIKRRRLFPGKYGPPKHPNEAASVGPVDVLRTNTKLDNMTKEELVSPKSFVNETHVDIRAAH